MRNLTPFISDETFNLIRRDTNACRVGLHIIELGITDDIIFKCWMEQRCVHSNWTLRAIDEKIANQFGISARTVRKIRLKLFSQLSQQLS